MKITEKSTGGDITIIPLAFERGTGKIVKSLTPTIDEPICVYYFPGGWQYGYPTFHVLIEYGDMEDTDYHFLALSEMCERFGLTEEEVMGENSYLVTQDIIKDFPNDQKLGNHIRSKFIKQNL